MSLFEACARELGLAVGDEERLANGIERRLERIVRIRTTLADPLEHFVDVALATTDALGQECADAERRRAAMHALEDAGLRFVVERLTARIAGAGSRGGIA